MYISTIVKFRREKGSALYEAPQVERYVDDQFFAFTRGSVSGVRTCMHSLSCKKPLVFLARPFSGLVAIDQMVHFYIA